MRLMPSLLLIPDDELSRRLSLAMAITERRGYLLTWFFAAPHDSELVGLTNERAIFDSTPSINVASATQPAANGKNNSASDAASFNATETLQTAAPANASAIASQGSASDSPAATSAASSASTTPAGGDQNQSSDNSGDDHPSLLRPGETMQTQQGKGVVIKPK